MFVCLRVCIFGCRARSLSCLVQMIGEERLKRGAYLAGLAEGPSVAQDLGLTPKDRLVLVEGLDVKMLPFDRIGERWNDSSSRGYRS